MQVPTLLTEQSIRLGCERGAVQFSYRITARHSLPREGRSDHDLPRGDKKASNHGGRVKLNRAYGTLVQGLTNSSPHFQLPAISVHKV